MRSIPVSIVCAAVFAMVFGQEVPARAQMAGALGKPLPVSNLPAGTVTVRVIAGAPDKPLIGIEVSLVRPDNTARSARTDAQGRATFANLKPGSRYVARARESVSDGQAGEPNEAASEPFTIPDTGGLRLMISTRPWQGGGASAAAGAAPMLDPRRMSGIPRGEPNDAGRTLTVSAVQGIVTDKIAGHPVHLVGYAADGSIFKISQKTGEDGRARFDNLVAGRVAYYAMSSFARTSGGQPVTDRVRSRWIIMPPQVGVRLMLAGLAAESRAGPVEDLDGAKEGVAPGDVVVQINGYSNRSMSATLYEIVDGNGKESIRRVASAPVGPPTPREVKGSIGDAVQRADQTAGTLTVAVNRQAGQPEPVPGASVEIVRVSGGAGQPAPSGRAARGVQAQAQSAGPMRSFTDGQGQARFADLAPGAQYRAVVTVYGQRIESASFTVPQAGGLLLGATVQWRTASTGEARFRGIAADKVYFAEVVFEKKPYRSAPFMTVPERGAAVGLLIYPRTLFSFHMTAEPDDEYMRFRAQMVVSNYSYAPWDPGDEGLVIPLPRGFVNGAVAEEDAEKVKVEPDRGLIWRGTVPPGRVGFLAGFFLRAKGGSFDFDMDLPMGVAQSNIIMRKNPGMEIHGLPASVRPRQEKDRNGGDLFVISDITILPKKSMGFSVSGLIQRPVLERYASHVVGLAVVAILAWGFYGIFDNRRREAEMARDSGRGTSTAQRSKQRKLQKKREELLDQLVTLESGNKRGDVSSSEYQRQRARLKRELERVYTDLDRLRANESSAA
ncbi:MAG: hypothetical protein MJE77_34790 [Proteobacteria bacterium]|nr:hypothetical protein [Pseudomonadota bacterium]